MSYQIASNHKIVDFPNVQLSHVNQYQPNLFYAYAKFAVYFWHIINYQPFFYMQFVCPSLEDHSVAVKVKACGMSLLDTKVIEIFSEKIMMENYYYWGES